VSDAAFALAAVVWLSGVALLAVWLVQRSPKRRKPVDELEATDASLRNRIVDLEDKFEHHVKREAQRGMRAAVEQQATLPFAGKKLLGSGGRRGVV